VANVECPEESLDWFEILQADLYKHDELFLAVSEYVYKVSYMCPKIRRTIDHGELEEIESLFPILLAEADAIENGIPTWTPSDTASSKSPAGYLPRLYTLNLYRGARIRLQHFLISLFNHVEKFASPISDLTSLNRRRHKNVLTARAMAQEILETVPYALGDSIATTADNTLPIPSPRSWADALRLVWPLAVVLWSPSGLHHQREMAQAALHRIGWKMGIRQALTVASTSFERK
jgi:hypothetical protein